MSEQEKYIVCSALPYANGPSHLGHIAGAYLPADIYVRYKRMHGHDVHFACGSDEHGVAITFRAIKEGKTPQEVVDKYHEVLKRDMQRAGIEFDIFSRTTHPCHIARAQEFFTNLNDKGLIEKQSEDRLYCSSCTAFLPDRYVAGTCPHCKSAAARGDQCEKCGTWYEPEELVDPICQLCGVNKASIKPTTHWYFSLDKMQPQLEEWLNSKTDWRKSVLGYAFQPIKEGLSPRAITRDLDWGVPVPLPDAVGKVLYVWFDAPLGYISASEDWSVQQGEPDKWKSYWEDRDAKLVHFIGKDNIIFHTVVWPAVLMGDGRYVLPHLIAGNEFLNLEGEKFSTSRNYALWLSDVLDDVPVDCLRYYLTSISPETSDSNFSWADYQTKINTELADIIGNLNNRVLSFINKNYAGQVVPKNPCCDLKVKAAIEEAYAAYCHDLDQALTKGALGQIVALGRTLNAYFQEAAPWKVCKEDPAAAHQILHSTACGIRVIALMLYPVCPKIAQRMWQQLGYSGNISDERLPDALNLGFPPGHTLTAEIAPLVMKVEDEFVAEQRAKLEQQTVAALE